MSELRAEAIRWSPDEPEPPATFETVEDLAVEILGRALSETFKLFDALVP